MKTSDFDYALPEALIAQTPIESRDQSRLMVLDRRTGSLRHQRFFEIANYLQTGDVLVFNNSRVIPARLHGRIVGGNSEIEILLLRQLDLNVWETLTRPGKRVKVGTRVEITRDSIGDTGECLKIDADVIRLGEGGTRVFRFSDENQLLGLGEVPLPPYIHTHLADPERYQTVYAEKSGSVAAPTAGLHFTPELIKRIKDKGVQCLFLTLHIGLYTFRPVREEDPLKHPIHQEYGVISQEVINELCKAESEGRRIICVGTTSVRLVEAAAQAGAISDKRMFSGWVSLFITPGYQFQMVDALITNFHLPRSTLLMLVTAFAGKNIIDKAYQEAITQRYRFYSFGDAMLVI